MSFVARDLSVLAYANGFTHWHYRTRNNLEEVLAPGYFTPAHELLRPGDQLTTNLMTPERIDLVHLTATRIGGDGTVSVDLLRTSA